MKKQGEKGTNKSLLLTLVVVLCVGVLVGGYVYNSQKGAGATITHLTADEAVGLANESEYQKIDFRPLSEYNKSHIEGFEVRTPTNLDKSDQLYEDKVMAMVNDDTDIEHINDNLDYLGINEIIYINGLEGYTGFYIDLLGACDGSGASCGLGGIDEPHTSRVQYAEYLGDGLFFSLGGSHDTYVGPVEVTTEDEVLSNAVKGELYRYTHSGIMTKTYPGGIEADKGQHVTTPAVWESPVGITESQEAFAEYGVEYITINADEYDKDDFSKTEEIVDNTLAMIVTGKDRLTIERVALDLIEQGYTRVIKVVESKVIEGDEVVDTRPLTVEDTEYLTGLAEDPRVRFWDVRNQGYENGRVYRFDPMPQRHIQDMQFTDEQKQELYIIYCRTGGVTAEVVDLLASKGVYNVIDLGGLAGQNVELTK